MTAFSLSILRYERILYRLHTVLWTNQHNRCTTTHHQTETSRFFSQFERLVGVAQVFRCVVQHQIEQRIVAFKYTGRFTAASELHTNGFLEVLAEVQNGFLSPFLFVVAATLGSATASGIL